MPSADGRRVALLWNTYGGRSEMSLLDLASGVQRAVVAPGEVLDDAVFAAGGDLLCVTAQGPVQPREVWLVDPTSGALRPLRPDTGVARTGDGGVAPHLVDLRARDGLPLSGWLYRPAGPGPWPTAISLHGGPEAQERPCYNPLFQALVAQGIAVFAPNVRGSSGFGRSLRRRRQPRRPVRRDRRRGGLRRLPRRQRRRPARPARLSGPFLRWLPGPRRAGELPRAVRRRGRRVRDLRLPHLLRRHRAVDRRRRRQQVRRPAAGRGTAA